jgi:hypothetical protein
LHLYREGYGDRWAVPLPARFSDASVASLKFVRRID